MAEEKRFATAADVRMRLNETFVKYGDDYFFAVQKPEDISTSLMLLNILTRKTALVIDANDPMLDVSSLPLGYVQFPQWDECLFMSRVPYRRQRQAVSIDSVNIFSVWSDRQHPPIREYFHQEFFLKNLRGDFPPYAGIITSIAKNTEKRIARAFDRCFCVLHDTKETKLQYNCTNIGSIDLQSKIVTLYPEHNHSVFTMRLAELGAQVAE